MHVTTVKKDFKFKRKQKEVYGTFGRRKRKREMLLLYYRLKMKRKNRRKDNSGSINSE